MTARAGRFPLFDSLRALAALSVIGVHGAFAAGIYDDVALRHFTSRLDVGVTIFFLISGFLLYRPFVVARMRDDDRPSSTGYAWRRLLRIVPAYWVALTIIAFVQLPHAEVFSLRGVITYYGFGQVYRPGTAFGGIPQAWTLCVEVGFYVFLPFWAIAMRRLPGRTQEARERTELVALALLFAASLLYKIVLVASGAITEPRFGPFMLSLPAFLDQFALGMALAVLSTRDADRPAARPIRVIERHPWTAWAAAGATFAVVSLGIGLDGRFAEPLDGAQFFGKHLLYALVALCVLLPAVFGDPDVGLVRRFLGSRVLRWLGLISYGLYLWHSAVFEQLTRWGYGSIADATTRYSWYAAGLATTIVVAAASYYLIERPALGLRTRVGSRSGTEQDMPLRDPPSSTAATAGRSPG